MEIRVADGGVEFWVHVRPRASRASVGGQHDGALQVQVRAAPVDGAANAAVCEAVANALGLRSRAVQLVAGARSRRKRLRAEGDLPALRSRLEALAGPGASD